MLELLGKNHALWLKMVIGFGCPKDVADDIVQEMYLKLHRLVVDENRIMYDDEEVNRFYVYITLKNLFLDYKNAKSKYTFVDISEYQVMTNDDWDLEERDSAFSNLMSVINEEINSWHLYDAKLCNTYFKSSLSLRDISTGSKISLTSIFNSVKNYKKILKEKFMEDVQDFYNGDYHLLK